MVGTGFAVTFSFGGIVESIREMPLAQQPGLWSKLQVQKEIEVSRLVGEEYIGSGVELVFPSPSFHPPLPGPTTCHRTPSYAHHHALTLSNTHHQPCMITLTDLSYITDICACCNCHTILAVSPTPTTRTHAHSLAGILWHVIWLTELKWLMSRILDVKFIFLSWFYCDVRLGLTLRDVGYSQLRYIKVEPVCLHKNWNILIMATV